MNFYYLLQAIESYYGQGSPQWMQVASGSVSPAEFASILKQLPNVNVVFNQDGTVRSYDALTPINKQYLGSTTASSINSNVSSSTKTTVDVPMNTTTTTSPSTGNTVVQVEQGVKIATQTGTATATAVKLKKYAIPTLIIAGTLMDIGKIVYPEMYSEHPEYFTEGSLAQLDPEKWAQITQEKENIAEQSESAWSVLMSGFLNVLENGKSMLYADLESIKYVLRYLKGIGALNTINYYTPYVDAEMEIYGYGVRTWTYIRVYPGTHYYVLRGESSVHFGFYIRNNSEPVYAMVTRCSDGSAVLLSSKASFETYYTDNKSYPPPEPSPSAIWAPGTYATYRDQYVHLFSHQSNLRIATDPGTNMPINDLPLSINQFNNNIHELGYAMLFGSQQPDTGFEGIENEPGATIADFSNAGDYDDFEQILEENYPDLFDKEITQSVVQPDGSVVEYRYIPIVMPTPNPTPTEGANPEEEPVSGTQRQADIEADPETTPETVTEYIIITTTDTPDPNIEDTGEGTTPVITPPTGSAEALYKVWNPTQTQLNNFGAWLWSSSFVDQLLKVFNDPMQAIIGLHKVFVTPSVGGTANIKVGYLDSGVSSNYINSQYVTVDCGSVSFPEEYNNVFDYAPFTEVNLYLPFIGFVRLDVNDIARSTINVKYHVDVLTGACLAEVSVTRDLAGGILYTYSGNCSVTYPLSSGSYMGIVGTIASIAGGIAGTLATGGAAAPMLLGAAAGAMNAHTNIERSGSLSGNSGAMGIKKPYLVISRPQTNLANSFETFIGKPANYTTTLSSASGFVSCTDVHLVNCNATDNEAAEIESLLKSGIII